MQFAPGKRLSPSATKALYVICKTGTRLIYAGRDTGVGLPSASAQDRRLANQRARRHLMVDEGF